MSFVMKNFLLALCALSASVAIAADPPPPTVPVGEQQALYTVRMFLDLCQTPKADPAQVRAAAQRMGFQPLPPEAARRFLGPREGEGWGAELKLGTWALTLDKAGVCSVYARKASARALEDALRAWLPQSGSGYTWQESEAKAGPRGQRTISWQLRNGPEPFALWALNTFPSEQAFFQAVVDLKMAK
jgi:hypothetical protein